MFNTTSSQTTQCENAGHLFREIRKPRSCTRRIWFRQVRAHGKRLQHVCTDQNEVVRGRKMLLQFISWTWSPQSMSVPSCCRGLLHGGSSPAQRGSARESNPRESKPNSADRAAERFCRSAVQAQASPWTYRGAQRRFMKTVAAHGGWKSVGLPLMTLCTVSDISDVELWCIKWSSTNVTENPVECEGDWTHGRCLTFAKAQAAKADTTHVRS